jgi:hypothetical protein
MFYRLFLAATVVPLHHYRHNIVFRSSAGSVATGAVRPPDLSLDLEMGFRSRHPLHRIMRSLSV